MKNKAKFTPLTIEEFKSLLKYELDAQVKKDPRSNFDGLYSETNEWSDHNIHTLAAIESVADGLERIAHDWENTSCEREQWGSKLEGINSIGDLVFLGVTAGGDWESPVFSIFYFDDQKILRCYIPEKGNVYNFLSKKAFGNSDSDEKAARMGWKVSPDDLPNFNDEKMREDIRLHFGIKKGK